MAKQFTDFYQETPIMREADATKRLLRLQISQWVANTLRNGMKLLGIDVPERM